MSSQLDISMTGANGDTINFSDGGDFTITAGLAGLHVPVTSLRIDESAGDGGLFRFVRRGVRVIDVPVLITSNVDRADLEVKLRRLAALTQNRNGGTTISVTYPTGEVWEIVGYYAGGAEGNEGGDTGNALFANWVMSFHCPQPFWTRTSSETFTVKSSVTGRGLLEGPLSKLRVSSSQTIGTIHVESSGDVDSYPVWQLQGPMDSCSATRASDGASWNYNAIIPSGTTIIIDTFAGTVVDQTGANKYGNLGASPKLFSIPAGMTDINVVAPGSDATTQITFSYQPRKEVVH